MIWGFAVILVGIVGILTRKKIVEQQMIFGRSIGMKYSDRDKKNSESIAIFVGIIAILIGLASMVGLIK